MKKTLIALAMLIAIPSAVSTVMAAGPGQGMQPGTRVEYMAQMLDLTPDQQTKLNTLFAEKAKQRTEMQTAMRAQMQTEMQAILTPAQFEKMNKLRELRMGSRAQGGGPGMAGRGPGSGPGAGAGCPGRAGTRW